MRREAWDILLGIDAKTLPISIRRICAFCHASMASYQTARPLITQYHLTPYMENHAFTAMIQKQAVIFYDGSLTEAEQRLCIGHEIGHLVCGHMVYENSAFDGIATLHNHGAGHDEDIVEEAATAFALRLLAPACVLWALRAFRPSDIENLCFIPHRASRLRSERMKELLEKEKYYLATRGKTCFLLNRSEQKLFQNFHDFIEHEKLFSKHKKLTLDRPL